MIPPLDLEKLNQQLQAWYAEIEGIEQTIADPERRAQMRQAVEQVRQGHAVVNAEYAKEIASIARRTAAVETQNAETLAQVAAVRAAVEQQQALAPAASGIEPPLVSSDVHLGFNLRTELLNRYAPTDEADDRMAEDPGSVSKRWAATEEVGDPQNPPRPTASEPPRKKPVGEDDAWHDLSTSEDDE